MKLPDDVDWEKLSDREKKNCFNRMFKEKQKDGWKFVQGMEIDPRIQAATEEFLADEFYDLDWTKHITVAKIANDVANTVQAGGTRCNSDDVLVLWICRLLDRLYSHKRAEIAKESHGRPDQIPEDVKSSDQTT